MSTVKTLLHRLRNWMRSISKKRTANTFCGRWLPSETRSEIRGGCCSVINRVLSDFSASCFLFPFRFSAHYLLLMKVNRSSTAVCPERPPYFRGPQQNFLWD